jgi:hypothetical protein
MTNEDLLIIQARKHLRKPTPSFLPSSLLSDVSVYNIYQLSLPFSLIFSLLTVEMTK